MTKRFISRQQRTRSPQSLRQWLKENDVNQRALGQLAGVHQSMISMLVSGKRRPRAKLLLKLHQITGVPMEALIGGRPPRRPPAAKPAASPSTSRSRATTI